MASAGHASADRSHVAVRGFRGGALPIVLALVLHSRRRWKGDWRRPARAWGPARVQQWVFWRPTHRSRGFICGQRASSVDALCAMHRATQQQHRAMPIRGSRSSGYGQHAWARRNRQEMRVHLAGRRNSWPHRSAMWQEERTTMWCVRACDASS
jgi:hypothetical protein